MAAKPEITRFRLSTLRRVLEIERVSFGSEAYTREMFLELDRDCGDLFFIAKRSGRIAGYIVTCAAAERAEIVSIAVDPRYRKIGIGKALMAHTLSALKKKGVRSVGLMVRASAGPVIRFYRRFGFRAVRRVPGYYSDGAEALRMRNLL